MVKPEKRSRPLVQIRVPKPKTLINIKPKIQLQEENRRTRNQNRPIENSEINGGDQTPKSPLKIDASEGKKT